MTTYLWFFVAFLSGWAMRVLIGNVADLIQSRTYGRTYLAVGLWNVFLMLLVIEMWVASPLSHKTESPGNDRDGSFLLFIILPTAVTLMAYLLVPEPGKYEVDVEVSIEGEAEDDAPAVPPAASSRSRLKRPSTAIAHSSSGSCLPSRLSASCANCSRETSCS